MLWLDNCSLGEGVNVTDLLRCTSARWRLTHAYVKNGSPIIFERIVEECGKINWKRKEKTHWKRLKLQMRMERAQEEETLKDKEVWQWKGWAAG